MVILQVCSSLPHQVLHIVDVVPLMNQVVEEYHTGRWLGGH